MPNELNPLIYSNQKLLYDALYHAASETLEELSMDSKHLGDTTRSYILNNQGKKKTARRIIDALSDMNGSDVLMGTQNSRNEKSPESF